MRDAAKFIVDIGTKALADRGGFRVALSGGNTPRPVYRQLAETGQHLPWERVVFTFGDERCVPPDDKESNFRMARETWFEPARVPDSSILRMRGEIDPTTAAQDYQDRLDRIAGEQNEKIYRHDLILLGMGDDGHTASLFPGTAALDESERRVAANFVPKFETWRLTFTYPLINQARHVCFLVDARKNGDLIERVLAGDRQYPAARVEPGDGKLTWIVAE